MKLNSNIRQTFRVAKIELSSMFYSPVAWLVLIIFALLIGYDYANVFDSQLRLNLWVADYGMCRLRFIIVG